MPEVMGCLRRYCSLLLQHTYTPAECRRRHTARLPPTYSTHAQQQQAAAQRTVLHFCTSTAGSEVVLAVGSAEFRRIPPLPSSSKLGTGSRTSRRYEYGRMVDFSFIVSLYVSDLLNVTISTVVSYNITRTITSASIVRIISMKRGALGFSGSGFGFGSGGFLPFLSPVE